MTPWTTGTPHVECPKCHADNVNPFTDEETIFDEHELEVTCEECDYVFCVMAHCQFRFSTSDYEPSDREIAQMHEPPSSIDTGDVSYHGGKR